MKKNLVKTTLLVGICVIFLSFDTPLSWYRAGSKPKSYDMGLDKAVTYDGKTAASIKSLDKKISGFGTLMQSCLPDKYLGKRVRMSGVMKSTDVTGWAGFWFRVDQANTKASLSFDNMQNRAIKGTTDWKKYEIVLDVPTMATNLAYGALLDGTGQIWFAALKFEIVDKSVPSTDKGVNYIPLTEPSNLDFQK